MKPQRITNGRKTHINMTNQLRNLRLDRKMTQAALAEKLKIPRGTYATLESGVCLPTTEVLNDITHVLRCHPEEVYTSMYLDIIKIESY